MTLTGCLLLKITIDVAAVQTKNDTPELFAIAAYLPDYRFYINTNQTAPFLTDLILFSIEPTIPSSTSDHYGCCLHPDHFQQARLAVLYKQEQLGQRLPIDDRDELGEKLRLWVTIGGGGGRSQQFLSNIRAYPQELANLIRDVALAERLHGVDLDCESVTTMEQYNMYLSWIHRHAIPTFHAAALNVSLALHPNMMIPSIVASEIDRIHMMTYDMVNGPYHADPTMTEHVITTFLQQTLVDSHKVLLGIPAYARHKDNPGAVQTFAEMVDSKLAHNPTTHRVAIQRLSSWKGYMGDSPAMVRKKVGIARKLKLGGVFIWELGQDKRDPMFHAGGYLLEAAADAVRSSALKSGNHRRNEL